MRPRRWRGTTQRHRWSSVLHRRLCCSPWQRRTDAATWRHQIEGGESMDQRRQSQLAAPCQIALRCALASSRTSPPATCSSGPHAGQATGACWLDGATRRSSPMRRSMRPSPPSIGAPSRGTGTRLLLVLLNRARRSSRNKGLDGRSRPSDVDSGTKPTQEEGAITLHPLRCQAAAHLQARGGLLPSELLRRAPVKTRERIAC